MLFQSISNVCIIREASVNTIVCNLDSSRISQSLMHHRASRVQVNPHPSPSV